MGDSSELVTVTCPDHHQTLSNGLWDFLQSNYGVDFAFKCAGREVSAHRLILDLFLSPDKLQDTVAGRQPSQEPGNRSEMDYLLQFLYRGMVTIPKTQLGILLELAKQSEFGRLVDALESTPEVRVSKSNLESLTPELATPKVEKLPPQHIPVTLVTENRQSVIETKDDQGTIVVKTEDEVMYEAVPLVDLSPEPEDIDWDQIIKSETDCQDAVDDGIIGSCLAVQFDQNFPSTADQHNPQDNGSFDQVDLTSEPEEQSPLTDDVNQETTQTSDHQSGNNSNHQCQLCEKSFAKATRLRTHLRAVHQKDAGHTAPHRQPSYTFKSDPSTWTFRCDQCQMMFCREHHLKRHQLIHSDERPYSCHLCELAFRQGPHLKRHLLKHHGLLPYKCTACDLTFAMYSVFLRHKKTHRVGKRMYL